MVSFSTERPWVVMVLTLLCVLAAGAGTVNLSLTADTRILAGPGNPVRVQLEAFEDVFSPNNNILIAVRPRTGTVFEDAPLEAVADLTRRAWALPRASRVDSITNFQHPSSDEETFALAPLVPDEGTYDPPDDAELEAFATRTLAEPSLAGWLIAPDSRTTAVNVNFRLPEDATEAVAEIISAVRALKADVAARYPEVEFHVTGNVALMAAFPEAALRDMGFLIPLTFGLIAGAIWVFLRSLPLTLALMSYLGFSVLGAMGLAGWAGHVVNPASAVAPVIIMTLSMAAGIHVVRAVLDLLEQGWTRRPAIEQAMRILSLPLVLTTVTTSIGFFALNFTDAPPFRHLGNLTVVGLILSLILSFGWLPAILSLMPVEAASARTAGKPFWPLPQCIYIARHHWRMSLAGFAALGTIVGAGALRIELNDDFIRYFDKSFEYRIASDFVEDNLTGLNILEFSFEAGSAGGIYEPDYQARLDEFVAWLRDREGVVHVSAISEILKTINLHLSDERVRSLPQTREEIAQYLLLYELSLSFGLDLGDRIDIERSATRVTAIVRGYTSKDIRILKAESNAWLAANAPPGPPSYATSINILFADLALFNIQAMMKSTFAALAFIAFLIFLAVRNVKLGVLSLVTNLLPAILGFGLWGYLVGDVGLASSVVVAMTLGIIVDDTIHFLLRYRWAKQALHLNAEEAVVHSIDTVGRAMCMTTAALVLGFLALIFSGFVINSSLGLFSAIIIVMALFADLILLPALLMAARNWHPIGPRKRP